ncbi:MAG: hypothetical protein AMS27_04735 [Bacteroides sp. SM23_62_1]|nr:MAG: hypothetical protein AMS27_04735 [Bacteroides sp. SM23_62_1]
MQIWSAEIKELETLNVSIKGRFPELEKEMEQLMETKDANVVMLYSRRCLEVVITDLCECELKRPRKTEPLKGIIDKLNREEKVPSNIIASMQSLNSLSTFGAHPKDFDPRQVKPVLNNLTTIIEWYLNYKDTRSIDKPKTDQVKDDTKSLDDSTRQISKPKKKLILLLSGLLIVCVIVIVVLAVFNVIDGRKQVEVDTGLERSIAVKPFYNLSGDPDQEYMCDGLTDEIINHLFKIASFDKVVSLSTVLTYKGTDKQLPQIAEELKVNYILEGTYKKIGNKVRVTAQLIEPKNDKHIWLQEYEQPYEEIITIQSDIALQIADHLKAFLTDSEKQNIQKIPTNNPEAYDLLQRTLYTVRLGTGFSFGNNTQFWDTVLKVIKLDPNYADAYALAGWFLIGSANYGGGVEIQSVTWDALHYLEKALEIDPDNGLAHNGLGILNDWFTWDYIKANREFLRAIELTPNYFGVHSQYGEFLMKRNRLADAKSCFEKGERPFQDRYREIRREILINDKRDAYNSINEMLDLFQEQGFRWAGEAYIWLEEYDSARYYLESAIKNDDAEMQVPRFQTCLALAYHKTNNDQQARTIINQLVTKSDETTAGSPDFFTGWYYSGIGEVDSAFYWLEKAYKNKSPEIPWLKVDPVFNNLKNDDRYWDLYERTGHKAYDDYMASKGD